MSNPLAQMGRLNQEGIPTPWRDNTICVRQTLGCRSRWLEFWKQDSDRLRDGNHL